MKKLDSSKQNNSDPIMHRLKIARGHLEKVIQMREDDSYCIDVVHQSNAVISALKKANQAILEKHISNCLLGGVKSAKDKEMVGEIVEIIKKA